MKGTVHAAIGATTPVGLLLTGHATLPQVATMAAVSAGFALLPDLDHPKSYATKALGRLAHKGVHLLSKKVVTSSATRKDKASIRWIQINRLDWDPYHRSLTHTLIASLAAGAGTYLAAWAHPVASAFIAALGVFLLWPLRQVTVPLVVVGAALAGVGATLILNPWLLSLAVIGGYSSHVLADACTKAGVPALWPVAIQGRRWWKISLLGAAISSGSKQERGPAVGVALASNALLVFLQF